MRAGLTPKREKFAHGVALGKSQADAYRAAYSAKGMRPATVQQEASRLMRDPHVSARVGVLTEKAAERAEITLESHLRDLMILRNAALKAGQLGPAITAEVARGKHSGVAAPEKRELGGPGGLPIPVAAVSPEEYRRIAAEVAAKT